MDEVAPFLGRNASLLQISNEAYVHGRPGDNGGQDPQRVLPLSRVRDHSNLLRNPELEGLLVRKMWNDGDALFHVDVYVRGMDEIVALIAQRLGVAVEILPALLVALVQTRAGGNPFFADDLLINLLERGLISVSIDAQNRPSRST